MTQIARQREIIDRRGSQLEEEGCLSLPEIRDKVKRSAWVKVRAQDVDGNWFEAEGEELLARAMQHEIDHLQGTLYIDKMRPRSFTSIENLTRYWKTKTISEIVHDLNC